MSKLTEDDVIRLIEKYGVTPRTVQETIERHLMVSSRLWWLNDPNDLQATDKETADEGDKTPHATQEEVGVYSDVPPYT